MRWHSIHVHYHDNRDPLIRDAVRPLFAELRSQVPAAYFQRHWRRGPHVRLNFLTEQRLFDSVVRPAVARVVGEYLAARPSTASLDAGALRSVHDRLADAERERGPRWPWLPDNSFHVAEYDPRLHTVGGLAAAELLADFYVATNELAFRMLDRVADGFSRLDPCFDLMVATAHAVPPAGLSSGFVSFRSHAEGYLAETGRADRLRDGWNRRYGLLAPALRRRLTAVVECVDEGDDAVPFVADWLTALRPLRDRAAALISSGAIDMSPPRTVEEPVPLFSPFHDALVRSHAYVTEVRDAEWFHAYRLMLNYLYLHMTRLGIPPSHRFLLCHLAANAAEEQFGVTALDLISRGARVG